MQVRHRRPDSLLQFPSRREQSSRSLEVIFSRLGIFHQDVEVFHGKPCCYFQRIRAVGTDEEALIGDVIVNCLALHGELFWETSGEELHGDGENFVACCLGTRETLDDVWMGGPEEIVADVVFGSVVGVEGKPV